MLWAPAETDAVTILLGWQIFCCLKLRGGGAERIPQTSLTVAGCF